MSLVIAAALAAASPVPLPPSGPWNVEVSEKTCLLSRPYGADRNKVLVGFQPIFTADSMELVVVGPKGAGEVEGSATIRREPDGKTFAGRFYATTLKDRRRYTRISTASELFEGLGDTSALTIRAGTLNVTVAIAKFDKAKPFYTRCEDDLLTSWGVKRGALDSEHQARPKRNPGAFFSASDYPLEAHAKGYIGRSVAILQIDPTGLVTDCRIAVTAGDLLDRATCERARKIPFTSGHDDAGNAVASVYILPVQWRM